MTNKTFLRISLANQKGESLPSKKQDYAILNIGAFGWFNSLCSLVLSSFQVQKSILPNTPDFATSIIIEMVDLGIQCMSSKEKSQIVLLLLLFFVCFRMRLWYWKFFCLWLVFSWDIIKLVTWRHSAVCGVFPWKLQESDLKGYLGKPCARARACVCVCVVCVSQCVCVCVRVFVCLGGGVEGEEGGPSPTILVSQKGVPLCLYVRGLT